LLTKKVKAWFFLLCGEQPKINELIFLVFNLVIFARPRQDEVCHQSATPVQPAFL
jgi:hypothetical protein